MPLKLAVSSLLLVLGASFASAADTPSTTGGDAPKTTAPDNSGVNKRDRDDKTLTPEDQAKNDKDADPSDLKVLAAVRRAITKDDTISVTGHNVKIMVKSGVATMRGPVKTAAEKARIAEIAGKTDGVTKVDDQLEIAASDSK